MNQRIVAILATVCIAAGAYCIFHVTKKSTDAIGTVIVLNGPSGSGKSSIQREFQALMIQPSHKASDSALQEASTDKSADTAHLWIKLGIDNLFDKPMPDITLENLAFWQSPNAIRWVTTTKDANDKPVVTLFTGQEGEKVAYGMNSAIAGYAQAGCNCIVDYIAYKPVWIEDLRTKLTGVKTYWVKIEIPLDVLEERERARGTSPVGHARSHYDTVYAGIQYDLVLDTSKLTAVECAQKIKEFIDSKSDNA
jgi:chloramphenicol 3-O phosphotransferase